MLAGLLADALLLRPVTYSSVFGMRTELMRYVTKCCCKLSVSFPVVWSSIRESEARNSVLSYGDCMA